MKRMAFFSCLFIAGMPSLFSQQRREDIYSAFVLYQHRVLLENDLRDRIIAKTFAMTLDSNTAYRYESACAAISQFQFANADVEKGLSSMFLQYDSLDVDTRQALLEATYAVYPDSYASAVQAALVHGQDPKLFAMAAVYLYRQDSSTTRSNDLKIAMVEKFPGYDSFPVLTELFAYLSNHFRQVNRPTPDVVKLFAHQKTSGQKIIYSFQRWNRDYPGLAIVQNADGHFAKDAGGRLFVAEQLARSGADLPYFITNGSTPQGIYSIQGTDVAHNNFIGPTPNIQLLLPFEHNWEKFFRKPWDPPQDSLAAYRDLLPAVWKNYLPMMEAWHAGRIGRTEIIAHGTALDPAYFQNKPYYPLTPTLGCLCAKELWNPTSGRLLVSEQFNLVSAFQSTPGNKGFLFVINLDNEQKPVSRQELEALVSRFEREK